MGSLGSSWSFAAGPVSGDRIAVLFYRPAPLSSLDRRFSGFLWELLERSPGIALGAAGGFCLSRWFLRKDISAQFRKHATFRAIDIAIEKEGWKIVILLRLCPIPFGLGKLSLRPDRSPFPTLSDRQPDRRFAEPFAVLPAWHCRKSRVGRHCLRSPWSQHRGIGGARHQRGGNCLRNCSDPIVRPQGCSEIRPGFSSFNPILASSSFSLSTLDSGNEAIACDTSDPSGVSNRRLKTGTLFPVRESPPGPLAIPSQSWIQTRKPQADPHAPGSQSWATSSGCNQKEALAAHGR